MITTPAEYQKDLFTKRYRKVKKRALEVNHLHIPLVGILHYAICPDVIWRHYPAGEKRDGRDGAKLKAMGVLPGCADLEFFYNGEFGMGILFLELKGPKGVQSPAQSDFEKRAKKIGRRKKRSLAYRSHYIRLRNITKPN